MNDGVSDYQSSVSLQLDLAIPREYKQALTVNFQCHVDRLLFRLGRVGAATGVDASVVRLVHGEGEDAPGHAVLHLCAGGGHLCVAPVPGERGRRVAALRDTRQRHPLAGPQVRARLVAQDRRRLRRICEDHEQLSAGKYEEI